MALFNIISELEAFAISKGWHPIYGFDDFYRNQALQKDYAVGEIVFMYDFQVSPTIQNNVVPSSQYTCLLMLGRKFDVGGTVASLDETSQQKYDRRLFELADLLVEGMAEFACDNELEVTNFPVTLDINVYDTNVDFAIANNAIFVR